MFIWINLFLFLLIVIFFMMPEYQVYWLKKMGLYSSFVMFFWSFYFLFFFDFLTMEFQFMNTFLWTNAINLVWGIDGLSIFFINLSTLLIPVCLLCSWNTIYYRFKDFMMLLFVLEFCLMNVFSLLDLVFFYIFFEMMLMPMFLMIGIWGSSESKMKASYLFFLYTLLGSVLLLIGLMMMYSYTGTTNLILLQNITFSIEYQMVLFLLFFFSFAMKMPMFPFHIWLPEAHVEAPTAGSVLLAGMLLKLGGYGFLSFLMGLFPFGMFFFRPVVYIICILGIMYTSCSTLRQIDMKKMMAYASMGHMNFVVMGLMTSSIYSMEGGILVMLGHGVVSSGLFLCMGVLYDSYKTRIINQYFGLMQMMPLFGMYFFFFMLSNFSFPTTSNFMGEFMILFGLILNDFYMVVFVSLSMFFSLVYSLWFFNSMMFGSLDSFKVIFFSDINSREFWLLLPLLVLNFMMGLYPNFFFEYMHFSVLNLLTYICI